MADVRPLHHDDAGILPQTPDELAATDIQRIDTRGPTAQQHIREPAGGGPHIEADQPGGVQPKYIERVLQLESATAGIAQLTAGPAELDIGVGGHAHAGLGGELAAHTHLAREDYGPRALTRGGESTRDQQEVQPLARDLGRSGWCRVSHWAPRAAH